MVEYRTNETAPRAGAYAEPAAPQQTSRYQYLTLGPVRVATRPPDRDGTKHVRPSTALRLVIGLLRRWRERIWVTPSAAKFCVSWMTTSSETSD
jgi:hypothetical protein